MTGRRFIVAVDIGATNLRVGLYTESKLLAKKIEPTVRPRREDELACQIARMAREVSGKLGVKIEEVEAVGIATIGPIDTAEGVLFNVANLATEIPSGRIPIRKPLEDILGKPVFIANDANAAVLAEHIFGAGRKTENLVYVTLSTGIGGGAIVDGRLLKGKDGNACEIGHIVVDMEERLTCGCGGKGHWEAYCSGSGIPKYTSLLAEENEDLWVSSLVRRETGGDPGKASSKLIYESAKAGDKFSRLVVEAVGRVNALGFASIVNIYDPELITIGGSIALNNPSLVIPPIRKLMPRYTINRLPEVKLTPLGEEVGLYGGLAVALLGLKGEI